VVVPIHRVDSALEVVFSISPRHLLSASGLAVSAQTLQTVAMLLTLARLVDSVVEADLDSATPIKIILGAACLAIKHLNKTLNFNKVSCLLHTEITLSFK